MKKNGKKSNPKKASITSSSRGLEAVVSLEDKGGRRSELDRRSFFAPGCIPERRSRQDRRIGLDRRIRKEDFTNLMVSLEPKRKTDAYIEVLRLRRMFSFCPLLGLLTWAIIIPIARILLRMI
jgi:hypothetical protein